MNCSNSIRISRWWFATEWLHEVPNSWEKKSQGAQFLANILGDMTAVRIIEYPDKRHPDKRRYTVFVSYSFKNQNRTTTLYLVEVCVIDHKVQLDGGTELYFRSWRSVKLFPSFLYRAGASEWTKVHFRTHIIPNIRKWLTSFCS